MLSKEVQTRIRNRTVNWYSLLIVGLLTIVVLATYQPITLKVEAASRSILKHINPPTLFDANPFGFTQVVVAKKVKKTIYASGQVAFDTEGNIVGDDLASQAEAAFDNVVLALKAAGATVDDVVRINTFVVDYNPEMLPLIIELGQKFSEETPPASTEQICH